MPEIKHTFTAGKMNKDLDERLVPNGEYRDALNIQVRTTDGDSEGVGNAGVVQNLEGNSHISDGDADNDGAFNSISYVTLANGTIPSTKIIGSVADEKNDKAYFFAAAPDISKTTVTNITGATSPTQRVFVDSIVEVDTVTEKARSIFVDRFAVMGQKQDVFSVSGANISPDPYLNNGAAQDTPANGYDQITVVDADRYRVGMILFVQDTGNDHLLFTDGVPGVEIVDLNSTTNILTLATQQTGDLNTGVAFKFIHKERALQFDQTKLITGINIIDDLLFFTDGKNEPKKINIKKSKAGTEYNYNQTQLYVQNPANLSDENDLVIISDLESVITSDVKKEHITVIRRAPKSAPFILMSESERAGETTGLINHQFVNEEYVPSVPVEGSSQYVPFPTDIATPINGDEFIWTTANDSFDPVTIIGKVVINESFPVELSIEDLVVTYSYYVIFSFVDTDLSQGQNPTEWSVELQQKNPIFETKFGRFAYRYKYEDNECSSFSPFSELVFLPGSFSYTPSKGFNDGMTNNIRQLIIKDFLPDISIRPVDAKAVDILWKTTDNANVYVIKTITRGFDSEWSNFNIAEDVNTGLLSISSEMIHRVLPSNQLLRSWDNVPKSAFAQEITANRVIYGNYLQGYNLNTPAGISQSITSSSPSFPFPQKSVKSDREYKFGIVIGDKYGRETPIIAYDFENIDGENQGGSIYVEKNLCSFGNSFVLQQDWSGGDPTSFTYNGKPWIDYIKYYVKETSNEYYNLIMDRWYDGRDGTIWLSFNSADRNKVDEETYLVLKNEHGYQRPVNEKAKYKILAISNEAPDYIKLNKNDFSLIRINRDNTYSGTSAEVIDAVPDLLINKKEIKTDDSSWGDLSITDEKFKGTKKVRIVGKYITDGGGEITAVSPYKVVSKVATNNSVGKVVLKDTFSASEVNMFLKISILLDNPAELDIATSDDSSTDNPDQSNRIQYFMELRDEVVENKPEFDGKFFVKVEKDSTLQSRVLNETVGLYNVVESYEIAYLSNAPNNVSTTGAFTNKAWGLDASDVAIDSVFSAANIDDQVAPSTSAADVSDLNEEMQEYYNTYPGVYEYIGIDPVPSPQATIPKFGPGDQTTTENFWHWWYSQGEDYLGISTGEPAATQLRTTNIFLDEIPAAHDYYFRLGQPYPISNNSASTFNWEWAYDSMRELSTGPNEISNTWRQDFGPPFFGADFDSVAAIGSTWGPHPWFNGFQGMGPSFMLTKNYHPTGLAQGAATLPSHMGQMALSSIGQENGFASGNDTIFYQRMRTPGTIFRFAADPNQIAFKVVSIIIPARTFSDIEGFYNIYQPAIDIEAENVEYQGSVEINSKNFSHDMIPDILNLRHTLITRFVAISQDGSEVTGTGVDINDFDPRGEVAHNGLGSFTIQILERAIDEEIENSSIISNNACWETEPKESTDLDIYYEASNSIPIELDDNNIQLFTKASTDVTIASRVLANRTGWNGSTVVTEQILTESDLTLVDQNYGNDGVSIKHDILGQLTNYKELAINDIVRFKHQDGTIVSSKILDHYTVTTVSGVNIPIPATRATLLMFTFELGVSTVTINDASGVISVGDQIIAPDIFPNGTFVESVFVNAGAGLTFVTASKPTITSSNVSVNVEFVPVSGIYKIDNQVWKYPIELRWFNCYAYGNGVESDRIRDDFNAPQIDNGVKVSSTFLEYGEERIGSGLIHSGLYNSISGVNELNQFNMAEKITKNLNPAYGSIQALKTRDTDLVTFCEDKVLRVLANKDAIFNADGNTNLTATSKTLGQAIPFVGDYGISKNPESMAADQYRVYFSDKQRGAILRLSQDGLTPISNVGMKSYFREHLKLCDDLVGTFDIINGEYNLTLNIAEEYQVASVTCPDSGCVTTPAVKPITVSFNEASKGWVSFKSFVPSSGVSVNGKYITSNTYKIYEHYDDDVSRNKFYDDDVINSEIEVVFNDNPSIVKSFKAVNYEGTQAAVSQITTHTDDDGNIIETYTGANDGDGEYYNLQAKPGWHVDLFSTDMQDGKLFEFINKENKWFNKISGIQTAIGNIDPSELSLQGIGFPLDDTATDGTTIPAATDEGTDTGATQTEEEVVISTLAVDVVFLASMGPFGFLRSIASGGAPPYTFNWQGPNNYNITASPTGNMYFLNGSTWQNPGTPGVSSSLPGPGTFTLTVTDNDGAQVQFSTLANSTNYPPA